MIHFLFIDVSVDDIDVLQAHIHPGTTVHRINGDMDGVEYVTQTLEAEHRWSKENQEHSGALTISIVAHGRPGELRLGKAVLNLTSLNRYSDRLQQWFAMAPYSLEHSNRLQLYACDVAAGSVGQAFMDRLHQITGANVHASTTTVGSAQQGGNWDLDRMAHTWNKTLKFLGYAQVPSPQSPFRPEVATAYSGVLAAPVATNNAFSVDRGIESDTLGNLISDDDGFGRDGDADGDPLTVVAIRGRTVAATGTTIATQYGFLDTQPDGSYAYTLDNGNPNVVSTASGDALMDSLTYTITDGTTTSTATLEITINGNDSFPPETNLFYQTIKVNNQMRFVFYNPLTLDYEIVRVLPFSVNALAYNPVDNFLYAAGRAEETDDFGNLVQENELVRIDNQGRVAGTGIAIPQTFAGDFDEQGNYWIRDDDSLTRVNISTGDQTTFTITGDGSKVGVADLVYSEGKLYGARGRTLVSFDIANPSGSTITRTDTRVAGLPNGSYGATWADRNGNLYVGLNEWDNDNDPDTAQVGAIFEIVDYLGASPSVELQVTVSATRTNDGSSDNGSLAPFVAPFIDLGDRLPTVAETTFTEKDDPTTLFPDVELIDPDSPSQDVASVNLAFSGVTDGADEILYVDGQPLNLGTSGSVSVTTGGTTFVLSYDPATGAIAVTNGAGGTLPLEDLELLLESLQYENQSDNPSDNNRGLVIDITDADGNTSRAVGLVRVEPVNDPPVLDLDSDGAGADDADYDATFNKGGAPVSITDGNATITDVDDTSFTEITVTVGGVQDGADEVLGINGTDIPLNADSTTSVIVGGSTFTASFVSGVLTFTDGAGGEISDADAEALLNAIAYENQSGTPTEGDRTLDVSVNDGALTSNLATSTITVDPNALPVATADTITTEEDQSITIPVLDNDAQGDAPAVVSIEPGDEPTNGTVTVNPDGTVDYVPNPNFSGPDTFTYTLTDANGDTSTAAVTVNVGPGLRPDAVPETVSTEEDKPITIDVLANDDLESGPVTPSIAPGDGPANGTVTVNPDGTIDYTPNPNFNGTDAFIYTITDADGNTSTATVNIAITVGIDSDGDGVPDGTDLDDDNDGILDIDEGNGDVDTDGDGVPDSLDLDADNDGILDVTEAGHDQPDGNGDGRVDGPVGDNGLADVVETTSDSGIPAIPPIDTDGDGAPDFQDLDTDNDGVFDLTESGNLIDANNDGQVDGPDGDGDGLVDTIDLIVGTPIETDGGLVAGISIVVPRDSNNNGIPDFREVSNILTTGSSGADRITGSDGDDILNGFSDPDQLFGGRGNDIINGGSASDLLVGGPGNDTANGGTNDDLIRGNRGNDLLNGGSGNDRIIGGSGRDQIFGGDGDDIIRGGKGRDQIDGGGDRDKLFGGQKRDRIDGGKGDDLIVGGRGKDILTGGEGRDQFRYSNQNQFGDVITDFELIKDIINLKRVKGINSMADLNLFQRGDDTLVKMQVGDRFRTVVRLQKIESNDLDNRHFRF